MSELKEDSPPTDKKIKLEISNNENVKILGESQDTCTSFKNEVSETPQNGDLSEQNISKKKRKKLLKIQQWEIKKVEKRKQEREKQRRKKQEARENGVPYRTGPSRKSLKHLKMSDSSCRVTVAIDLSFDHLMTDKVFTYLHEKIHRLHILDIVGYS